MSLETTSIDSSNGTDKLTFHDACAKGNMSAIIYCMAHQKFDMYTVDNLQRTGFHLACFNGNVNVVQFLLQQEFDMYVGDNDGRTGFHLACFKGNLNVVQFLFKEGFDMNFCASIGRTGFHAACFNGNLNVVQFLLLRGFDMNLSDNNGFTGFHMACSGHLNAFQVELGFTAPDAPVRNESTRFPFVCRDANLNVVQFLLQQGFDMNLGDKNGLTGFHFACLAGNLKVAQCIVQKGFDMNTGDNTGSSGFIWACLAGNLNIIWFLLHHGFTNINEFSIDRTGLDILISKRDDYANDVLYMPCVLFLMEAGGEVTEEHDDFEELISAIQNRIIEISFIEKIIDKKWTGRIAQLITNFTMEPFTDISLHNLSTYVDYDQQPTTKICPLF